MSRFKRFIDSDVLTEAKERIRHIFDTHDSVVVCFSGGKDSLATLHLVWEIAQERGEHQVNVIFRDEELIPDPVIDFVDHYRQLPWVKMLWFALPLRSGKFVLGTVSDYIQWDPNRKHLRPVPAWAITAEPGDNRVFDQFSMDSYAASYFKGKVAFVTGIRAAEGLMRLRASLAKLNDNYINACSAPNASLCKPLYDWQENDIFKFFMEREIRYCPLYDSQHVSRTPLRVATPLLAEKAKIFGAWRSVAPTFYQQVVDMFPEMLAQERYWKDLDQEGLRQRYGQSYDGVRAYIVEHIEDEAQQAKALARLKTLTVLERNKPGSYPPRDVLRYITGGSFKRMMLPVNRKVAHG